jgi:LmbE family N-acetylglucosaminyl deacetylase
MAINDFVSGFSNVLTEHVNVERARSGKPHQGKVLVAIQANAGDIPILAAGTCAKLIDEGYTGYLVRTTNDDKSGEGSVFQNIKSNEQENLEMAKKLGFADVLDLYYINRRMDETSLVDLRGRIVFILRMLKADTVISYFPQEEITENPDHTITGRAVEQACQLTHVTASYPEHFDTGAKPHMVTDQYYAAAKHWHSFNRVVDIGSYIEKKIDAIAICRSQGGASGSQLRQRLAHENKRLPVLGTDDQTADREYIRTFLLTGNKQTGEKYGLDYAERFLYVNNQHSVGSSIDEYIKNNAVSI